MSHQLLRLSLACFAVVSVSVTASRAQEITDVSTAEEPKEIDYAKVAEDARKIADQIEERMIPSHMSDARSHLVKSDGIQGHPKAEEAFIDMEEMISFCNSTGGKAGAACEFKLKLSMGMNPGNTLGQFSKGIKPGQGSFGSVGQGSAGQSGGSTPYSVYGPQSMAAPNRLSSRLSDKKSDGQSGPNGAPERLAGNVDEINSEKNFDTEFSGGSGDRIIEEYRGIIEQYFKRLAEQDQ